MDKRIAEAVLDRACEAYAEIADDCMGLVRRKAMSAALTAAQQQGQAVACECPIPLDDPPNMHAPGCVVRQPMQQGGGEVRIPSAAEWCDENAAEATMEWRAGWDSCRVEYPRTAPPSAPVGVDLSKLQRHVWSSRGWEPDPKGPLVQFKDIEALAQQPAAVDGYTTGHCERHKQPGGCDLHNLSCGWPSCDRRPAAPPDPSNA